MQTHVCLKEFLSISKICLSNSDNSWTLKGSCERLILVLSIFFYIKQEKRKIVFLISMYFFSFLTSRTNIFCISYYLSKLFFSFLISLIGGNCCTHVLCVLFLLPLLLLLWFSCSEFGVLSDKNLLEESAQQPTLLPKSQH